MGQAPSSYEAAIQRHLDAKFTFKTFFAEATLTRQCRYLDKLVDELAKGEEDGEDPAGVRSGPTGTPVPRHHGVNRRATP